MQLFEYFSHLASVLNTVLIFKIISAENLASFSVSKFPFSTVLSKCVISSSDIKNYISFFFFFCYKCWLKILFLCMHLTSDDDLS